MGYMIIDAHMHLWDKLKGNVNGYEVRSLGGGRSTFMGDVVQMMPPYMLDGRNTAELFTANMDYAGVSGAVVTQEYIDGDQNNYLLGVKEEFRNRFVVCGLAEFRKTGYYVEVKELIKKGFKAIKLPAQWLVSLPERVYMNNDEMIKTFKLMEEKNIILSVDLAEGDLQVSEMKEVIQECPNLKIAIGHFGMVNRPNWQSQLELALNKNVMLESGGITWLYHNEFYPYKGAVEAVKKAADVVGIDKLMWGSDYPRTMTAITYKMSFDFIIKNDLLSEEEKTKFLGTNAYEFYGFKNLNENMEYIKNMVE